MAKLTWRIWLLIACLLASVVLIINWDYFSGGLLIKDVSSNSYASQAGISSGDILSEMNGQKIATLADYASALNQIKVEEKWMVIETNNGTFSYNSSTLDFTLQNKTINLVYGNAEKAGLKENLTVIKINTKTLENITFDAIKQEVESRVKVEIKTNKGNFIFLTGKDLGILVDEIPLTNIKTGLDLQGGARALVKPERELDTSEMQNLISVMQNRFNTYGIKDVTVRNARDISGTNYVIVEMAGATPNEIQDLVSKQGKFEAKIGQEVVFVGGRNDITFVARDDPSKARIETCYAVEGGESCKFSFAIHLSEAAAKRQASITAGLSENASTANDKHLNETLDLFLDDKLVDVLYISSDLKGQETTQVSISGSGFGKTKQEAYQNANENMKKLQTILITGSLPYKLEIVKLDTISPSLGKQFTSNVLLVSAAAFIGVCIVIYLRYKKMRLFIPVLITMVSELLLTLGLAVLIKWNLDLAGIAGIIAAIGTGVDDQIVMIDESTHGPKDQSLKEKIKRAFTIIFGAYATVVASLLPLWWAGAGLLRGFAVTTLLGISIGVFITRQAFGDILKLMEKE